jgi:uncharacterized protein (DUF2249 family)
METMIKEHVRCESLLAGAEKAFAAAEWPAFRQLVIELRDTFLAHFETEEEVVFPQFERATGLRQPTAELRLQHQRMREILEALASVSPAHDPEGCGAELATLAALFRQHRETEEETMYPAFGRASGEASVRMVVQKAAPELDLRGLEPPQPIVRIFEALQRAPGEPLRVVLPHEPHPLYGLLRERGFEWSGAPRPDGGFELTIRSAQGAAQ